MPRPKYGYVALTSLTYFISLPCKLKYKIHKVATSMAWNKNTWVFIRFSLDPHIKTREELEDVMYFGIEMYHITLAVEKKEVDEFNCGDTIKPVLNYMTWTEWETGAEDAYSELEWKPAGTVCEIRLYFNPGNVDVVTFTKGWHSK